MISLGIWKVASTGLVTSFLLELLVYPAIYYLWKRHGLREAAPGTNGVGIV